MAFLPNHVYDCECLSCVIKMRGTPGPQALLTASDYGDLALVREIIAHGVYDNDPSLANGYSALMAASSECHDDVVKELLLMGSNPNAATIDKGFTSLMYASEMGGHDVVVALLAWGANPNMVTKDGSTAWSMANANYRTNICELLVEAGARPI